MRSRAARWTFVAVAWIAIGASGYFLSAFQNTISNGSASARAVDLHAREAADAIADLRVSQQAYVALGQGVAFWMPKVAATSEAAVSALTALKQASASADAVAAVDQASAAIAEFIEVDKRAREYIRAGQTLMAGDVIFTEGGQLTAVAARQVETARQDEHRALEAAAAEMRSRQAILLAIAAAISGIVMLLLATTGAAAPEESAPGERPSRVVPPAVEEGIVSHARPITNGAAPAAAPPPAAPAIRAAGQSGVGLKAAADLATDFGRVRDSRELSSLLGRAAELIDATGLVVWMGNRSGSELRPVLTHGYEPKVLARIPPVPRSADNAAAAAYRTGTTQIVVSRPGGASGAIVAPILGADGCLGALSAEIKGGGEGSESVVAVTTIVAAHLAGVLASAEEAAEAEEPMVESAKTAAQG